MRKSIIMGLGLALSLAGVAAAQQPGADVPRSDRGGREHGRGGKGVGRGEMGEPGERGEPRGLLFKDITLTEAQKTQLKQLREARRDRMEANRESSRKELDEMRAARERGDTAAVRAIRERNRQAMTQARDQELAEVRNILTAEQRAQFDKNVAELKAREARRGDRFGGEGRGRGRSGRVG